MEDSLKNRLSKDPDGLLTYEYIANNIDSLTDEMPQLVDIMTQVDPNGQFCVSAARYLNAIDRNRYAGCIATLVAAAIDKDRNRAYIGQLLAALWGDDYADRVDELSAGDNNFRRIYKRIYPSELIP